MGKGDKKSRRGKIILGSYGVRRHRKKAYKAEVEPLKLTKQKDLKEIKPPKEKKEIAEIQVAKEKPEAKVQKVVKEKKEVKEVKEEKVIQETKAKKEKKS